MIRRTTLNTQGSMIGRPGYGAVVLVGMVVMVLILSLTQTVFGMGSSQKIEKVAFASQNSTIKRHCSKLL